MDSLTHYLLDPQHVSEQIQSLYERVSALERQVADLMAERAKTKEAHIMASGQVIA